VQAKAMLLHIHFSLIKKQIVIIVLNSCAVYNLSKLIGSIFLEKFNQIKNNMEEKNEDGLKISNESIPDANVGSLTKNGRGAGKGVLKFVFSLGGLVVFVFLIAAVIFRQQQNGALIPGGDGGKGIALSSKVSISAVGANAFGVLSDLSAGGDGGVPNVDGSFATSSEDAAGSTDKAAEPVAASQGGSGVGGASPDETAVEATYPYEPTYYVYTYKGADFTQNETKMNVLKRTSGVSGVSASVLARSLDFNLFDLRKLNSAKTSNLSFFEDREFGYRTDIDLDRGAVSIYKNYEKWPEAYADCKGDVCSGMASSTDLQSADLPSDEEIIKATNAFLNDYKVDLSAYGTPEVNKDFLNYSVKGQEAYIPEEVAVAYPLVVDGKSVFESYGEIDGLSVNYDVRNRKVSSMYNLMTHSYQSSNYEAETDVAKILEAAKNVDGTMPMPLRDNGEEAAYKKIEIELDTPFLSFENMNRYEGNQNSEYLVPCLVFPVKNGTDMSAYARKRVVVPIIKDFLNQNDGGPVMIMKGATSAGSAASVPAASVDSATSSGSVGGN